MRGRWLRWIADPRITLRSVRATLAVAPHPRFFKRKPKKRRVPCQRMARATADTMRNGRRARALSSPDGAERTSVWIAFCLVRLNLTR